MADNVYQLNIKLGNGETKRVRFTAPQGKRGEPGPQGPAYTLTDADKNAIVAAIKATVTPASIGAAYEPIVSTTDITAGSTATSARPYHVIE